MALDGESVVERAEIIHRLRKQATIPQPLTGGRNDFEGRCFRFLARGNACPHVARPGDAARTAQCAGPAFAAGASAENEKNRRCSCRNSASMAFMALDFVTHRGGLFKVLVTTACSSRSGAWRACRASPACRAKASGFCLVRVPLCMVLSSSPALRKRVVTKRAAHRPAFLKSACVEAHAGLQFPAPPVASASSCDAPKPTADRQREPAGSFTPSLWRLFHRSPLHLVPGIWVR